MYRWFLALRYLLTRPINILGMLGVTLGVWALIVVVSIFSGFLKVASEHVRAAGSDVSVLAIPQRSDWEPIRLALTGDPNVAACAPRLVHYGLLSSPGKRPGAPPLPGRGALQGGDGPFVSVLGIVPAEEFQVTGLRGWLAAADPELRVANVDDPLAPIDGRPVILLGEQRMRNEGIRRGDPIVLTTGQLSRADRDGNRGLDQIRIEYRVAGAYRSRHGGFDGNTTFVALAPLRTELAPTSPGWVQEASVRVVDGDAVEDTADRLQRLVSEAAKSRPGGLPVVWSWRERDRSMLLNVEHQRSLMKIVLIVIMVAAAFLMYATLSMMVAEKTGDIGILTAMGGTPLGVMQVFLACGLCVTLLGIALGVVSGCLSAIYLEEFRVFMLGAFGVDLFPVKVYNLDRVPYDLDLAWILQVAGMAFVTGVLVSALPAFRAARHDPLVSLRGT